VALSVAVMSAPGNNTVLPEDRRAVVLADALQSRFAAQCAAHQRRPRPEPTPS
jgi:hypothetical protein